jgi:hypothetical protein
VNVDDTNTTSFDDGLFHSAHGTVLVWNAPCNTSFRMVGTASHTLERIFVTTDAERGESGAAETQEEEEEDSSILYVYLL